MVGPLPLAFIRRQCLAAVLQGRPQLHKRLASRTWPHGSYSRPSRVLLPVHPPGPLAPRRCIASSSHMSNVQIVTSDFLSADDLPPGTHLHLIVLNYVLPQQTAQLWNRASTRICADGGANRLYDQIVDMLPGVDPEAARNTFLPDLIKGDLDSVRADVQDFYTNRGVPMIDLSSDQETTDLEKCLLFLEGRLRAMSERRAPEAAAVQHQHTYSSAVVAAATAVVPSNGLGHGAKAIGAVNAAKAPNGAGAHSSSNGSSFTAARPGSSSDAGAPAAMASSEVDATASVCVDASDSTAQQQEMQQHNGHHQPRHHSHHHNHHHHHQERQQQHQQFSEAGDAAASQILTGRIVLVDSQVSGAQAAAAAAVPQQNQQQQQQPLRGPQLQQAELSSMQHPGQAPATDPEALAAIAVEVAETAPLSGPCAAPSPHAGSGSTLGWAAAGACGNGSPMESSNGAGVQEVLASVLANGDGPVDHPSKRLQQEHVILVLGALGGRLDHTLSNLNTLYCYRHLNMALWGDGNLVRLLRAGQALIKPSRAEGPTCGLVPLARPATASSTGLKWDLDNTHMCFRGLLSTSNIISSDTITVSTDEDLLWITAVEDTLRRARPPQQRPQQLH